MTTYRPISLVTIKSFVNLLSDVTKVRYWTLSKTYLCEVLWIQIDFTSKVI